MKFEFGVVGDTPYSKKQEREFSRVIETMNKANLAFVVHVGDFEIDPRPFNRGFWPASMPCVEENFKRVLTAFQTSKHPFLLTPGDNDWTDCRYLKARQVNPLDALAMVRGMFFPRGQTLGQHPMPVASQGSNPDFSKFVENLAWARGGISFATVHVVGSNNNFGPGPQPTPEFTKRTEANSAWLNKAFATAKAENSLGLVLFAQANPAFEVKWGPKAAPADFRHVEANGS